MTTTVSSKGQIVLPAEMRKLDDVRTGQEFEVERLDRGEYLLRRRKVRNRGLVPLLRACPDQGWFQRVDRAETTDSVPLTQLR